MKRISITKAVLALLVAASMLAGGFLAFVFINPNVLGLLSYDGRVTISVDDYNALIDMNDRYGKLERIRRQISENFYTEVDEQALEDSMIKGLVAGLGDIYSAYYTEEEYKAMLVSLTGEYEGVGITMVQTEEGIRVLSVTKDSPAAKGGVGIGEYILKVDGVAYDVSTMDLCAAAIRGKKGSKVTITFDKDGEIIERSFKRAKIYTDTVEYKMLDDNIGYILLSSFESHTVNEMKEAVKALSGADALVIDMRDNPGGLVDAAIDIADMFMDEATLFYVKDHDGEKEIFGTENGKLWDKPFAVLINANSASAAEIMAVGMQENEVASIIGTDSFGKGIIQSAEQYKDGTALKLTVWEYFGPSGVKVNGEGVHPDVEVELLSEDFDEDGKLINDRQLDKAVELLTQ